MRRRDFIAGAAAASIARGDGTKRPPLCIFSKHLARFNYGEVGKHARDIGFDGVDLTVRPKGHVLPERAAEDMPKAIDTIHSHGLLIPMITTGLTSASDPAARPTLSTAARLKVSYWKLGYYNYALPGVEREVERVRASVAGLANLSREYGITAGYHNHSGMPVGAAVWDIRAILEGLDPKWIGYYYDPAHARIEGGLGGWRISEDMVLARLKMVALKDFYWAKDKTGKWDVKWCPMGEGMVDWETVFQVLARGGFSGPVSLHVEYEPADELEAIHKDFEFARKKLTAAYTV